MELISNSGDRRHYDLLMSLAAEADEMTIASPFCFPDFRRFAQDLSATAVKTVTFITTLKSDEIISKAGSLLSFSREMNAHGIEWHIRIDDRLHGKVYVFKRDRVPFSAVVTSANITDKGMRQNHEWGCVLKEEQAIRNLEGEVIADTQYDLPERKLEEIIALVESYKKTHDIPAAAPAPCIDISGIVRSQDLPKGVRIFIKPIGSAEHKVFDGDYSEEGRQYFSKKRPAAVRKGDILIAYAVGATKIISAFRVQGGPFRDENADARWPWCVEVENITPGLGKNWPEKNLFPTRIAKDYAETYGKPVTNAGGMNLNGLMQGNDKIQLKDAFGRYLLAMVIECDRS